MSTTPQDNSKPAERTGDYLKLRWGFTDRFLIEAAMVRKGGYITVKGIKYGEGAYHHFKAAMTALWPHFYWFNGPDPLKNWPELLIKTWVEETETGVMGPASTTKTYCAAGFALCTFYIWPTGTSILMSSTTREGLQLRIWGAVKELHNKAKARRDWVPGRIIESRYMLTGANSEDEAQDFRDGILGIPARVGGTFVGISSYVGLKNDRVYLFADEASLMPRGFLDSVANLRKNPVFKLVAMGNPKDRTDALGIVCEPHPTIGGWEGLTQEETTATWRTRANGKAIQICGYDSPNFRYPRGLNPWKGVITPEHIEADLAYYGRDSLQFSMMNLGIMPRDGGTRRVITSAFCEINGAMEEAVWADSTRITHVLGLDAAYSGVGGDRCALDHEAFGPDVHGNIILAQIDQLIVPIKQGHGMPTAEDQIVRYVMAYAVLHGIPPGRFGLDSTGRGTLVSAFARIWSPEVMAIEFGGLPDKERRVRTDAEQTESEAYGKKVTALWFASRLIIEGKQQRGLTREVIEDGACREWGVTKSGKTDVEPKDKTKERMGRSPDLWDARCVTIEVARRNGFQIAAGHGVGIRKKTVPPWLKDLKTRQEKLRQSHSLTLTS